MPLNKVTKKNETIFIDFNSFENSLKQSLP